ncbi:YbfB/YjiJ family MFS transporter [Bacillaceae bacterium W0354]
MTKHPRLFLIGGIFSLMIAMGIGRFAYTPILPHMQQDLSFSNAVAGFLATSNYAGYFIGAILASLIPLRSRRTELLRLSLIISVITTGVLGLIHSYIFWYMIRFLSGVASAFVFVLASSIVLDELGKKGKSGWAGIFYGGVGFGIFFSSLVIPSLSRSFSWEGIWLGLSIMAGVLTFFVWIWLKESSNRAEGKNQLEVITRVPPNKWLPFLLIAYGFEGLGYIVTGTFIVSIADQAAIFSDASLVWLLVGLAAIPSCMIWSRLAAKWGFVRLLVIAMMLQAAGIAIPVFWNSGLSFIISALLFGATFMGITTLATTLGRQMNPTRSHRNIGLMTAFYAFGQMVGPAIAGKLSTYTGSFDSSILGAAGVVFLGACLVLTGMKFDRIDNNKSIS